MKNGKFLLFPAVLPLKEAFAKAMGTGFGKDITFQSICILPNDQGEPILISKKNWPKPFDHCWISISHEKNMAMAMVILEKDD